MSYNGIGLKSSRGSGTNGYVTRSHADVRNADQKRKVNSQHGGFGKQLRRAAPVREVDKSMVDHHRRRQIEVQLAEMQDRMEDAGVPDAEIERRLERAREDFTKRFQKDEERRKQIQEQKEQRRLQQQNERSNRPEADPVTSKNNRLNQAFNMPSDYQEGEAFDSEAVAIRREARMIQKQIDIEKKKKLGKIKK